MSTSAPAAAVPANTPIYLTPLVQAHGHGPVGRQPALYKILNTPDPGAKIVADRGPVQGRRSPDQRPAGHRALAWREGRGVLHLAGRQLRVLSSRPPTPLPRSPSPRRPPVTRPPTRRRRATTAPPTRPIGSPGQVFGTVGNFLVEGDLDGFKAAVDVKGDSLGDSSDFKDSIGDLPDYGLGTVYTIPKDFIARSARDEFDPEQPGAAREVRGRQPERAAVGVPRPRRTPSSWRVRWAAATGWTRRRAR